MKPLLTILLLSVTSCPCWGQEDDPELRDRFLRGVAKTGRKLEQRSLRAKCVKTTQLTAVSDTWKAKYAAQYAERKMDPHKVRIKQFEMAIRGDLGLATGVRKNGNTYFEGRNNAYAFSLERSPEGKWPSLQFVEQRGVDPAIDAKIAKLEGPPRAMAQAGYTLWGGSLLRQIESDRFTIDRVYAIPSEDKKLVRVDFGDAPVEGQDFYVTEGFLVCDPAREWILTEYGGTFHVESKKETYVRRFVVEAEEVDGGIPIATKVSETLSWPNDPGTTFEFVSTIEAVGRDVPEEEFYLSFYGLPEPNFDRSWLGTWGWYLLGGIGCIVIGAIIKWRKN